MREFIKKQLERCVFANLNNFDPKSNSYLIPKYTKPKYDLGKCYLIKLPGHIINNPQSVLATNWNGGNFPSHAYYKAYVSKQASNYIYVDCLAFDFETGCDLNIMWSGWLDATELIQIATL